MEPGIVFAPYVWAQCIDKNGKHLNAQAYVPSDAVIKTCITDEDGNFLVIVDDEYIDKIKTDYAPSISISSRGINM